VNVLVLSPWFPSPPFGGALIRVFETLRHLSRRNSVTVLAAASSAPEPDHVSALKEFCAAVVAVPVSESSPAVVGRFARGLLRGMPLIQGLHYDVNMAHHFHRLTSLNRYDVIHVEHSFMAPYLPAVALTSPAKKILSMHNIESLRFQREMKVLTWGPRRLALLGDSRLFQSWEIEAVRKFDAIAVVSLFEQQWVRQHAPGAKVAIVPNGVNVEDFKSMDRAASPHLIVFPGLMSYPPNADAATWFCNAILPRIVDRYPHVRFSIVGDKPPSAVRALARKPVVEVTGRVADVRPYLDDCTAVVVPIRSGAGTRLKILEAMAMGRPVVSTSQGAEGLDVIHGTNILIGDTPEAFANHVCALFANPLLAARLGRAGRQLVETAYDWRICFRHLDTLYEAVTETRDLRDVPAAQGAVQ
jgi:sugar transferase (PEP-CTERM/EpsH1 system associated)